MSEQDAESQILVKEPLREQPGKRIFISNANTYEGKVLFEQLWNWDKCREPEHAAHSFVGTVRQQEVTFKGNFQEPPEGIEIVKFERTKEFRETLLTNNVIIYDLVTCDYDEVDYVIKTLKTADLSELKTLVLLSSVMTWVNTPPKFEEETEERPEGEEEAEPENEEGEDDANEPDEFDDPKPEEGEEESKGPVDENGEPIERKKPLYFKEKDYHMRVPHEDYADIKTIETLAMAATSHQELLRVHILCSGIRYGFGENIFYHHFQRAWIQNPASLQVTGSGSNLVPTIHIQDLAALVRRIVIEAPRHYPYIFAVDKTKRPTQKRIVTSISKCMGTGKVETDVQFPPGQMPNWADRLSINLLIKSSDAFKDGKLTAAEEEDENLEEEQKEQLLKDRKFLWHCQSGIIGNMTKLNQEFNERRGLNPVKIFVSGPPASGKTFYSD